MLSIQTILFTTDDSPAAEVAWPIAQQLAQRYGAALHVLRVDLIPPAGDLRFGPTPQPDLQRDGVLEVRRRYPNAADAITTYATEIDADLIVMGTHGRSGLNRLALGSTAERVLRQAPCSVITVGTDVEAGGSGPILVPLAFESASDAALEVALGLAEDSGARLVAVHAVELLDIPVPYGLTLAPFDWTEVTERVRETIDRWVAPYAKGPVPIETDVRQGEAARVILDAADRHDASLVVQASHGRRGLGRWLLGSVAETVTRHAPCPVLTLRVGARPLLRPETQERTHPVPREDWAILFDALSDRVSRIQHTVSVDILSPDAEGVVYDAIGLTGLTYDRNDDAIKVMTESGEHHIVHPFSVRTSPRGRALNATQDASSPGPWALEVVRSDGTRERITLLATDPVPES